MRGLKFDGLKFYGLKFYLMRAGLLAGLAAAAAGCNRASNEEETPANMTAPAFYAVTETDLAAKAARRPYTLALVAKGRANAYYQDIVAAAQKRAAELKVQLQVTYGDTAAEQESQIATALAGKPDALLVIPADSKQIVPALARAVAQKVTVVHLGDEVHPAEMKKQNLLLGGFVGNDNIVAGKQATAFYRAMGKGAYLKLRSTIKNTTGSERGDGLTAANHGFPQVALAAEQIIETPDQIKPTVEKAVHDHKDLVGVLTTDDSLALAASAALAGKRIPTFGFGGSSASLSAVQAGKLGGTINCHPEKIGANAVSMAVCLLNGELKAPARLILPAEAVVKSGS